MPGSSSLADEQALAQLAKTPLRIAELTVGLPFLLFPRRRVITSRKKS